MKKSAKNLKSFAFFNDFALPKAKYIIPLKKIQNKNRKFFNKMLTNNKKCVNL
jgi:hypothetical protein